MNWLSIIKLMPQVLMLIKLAEDLFKGAKTGPVKKGFVVDGVKLALQVMVSAGVIKEDIAEQLISVLDGVIEGIVSVLNDTEVFRHGG